MIIMNGSKDGGGGEGVVLGCKRIKGSSVRVYERCDGVVG